jgi:hypothetical protein
MSMANCQSSQRKSQPRKSRLKSRVIFETMWSGMDYRLVRDKSKQLIIEFSKGKDSMEVEQWGRENDPLVILRILKRALIDQMRKRKIVV